MPVVRGAGWVGRGCKLSGVLVGVGRMQLSWVLFGGSLGAGASSAGGVFVVRGAVWGVVGCRC